MSQWLEMFVQNAPPSTWVTPTPEEGASSGTDRNEDKDEPENSCHRTRTVLCAGHRTTVSVINPGSQTRAPRLRDTGVCRQVRSWPVPGQAGSTLALGTPGQAADGSLEMEN